MLVTFVVPVAPHHAQLAQRAITSALRQTIRSEIVHVVDEDGIGAGAMRNLLVQTVTTPFVVFLDADDEVQPDYVERTVFAYKQGRYVYTDWRIEDGALRQAQDCSRGGVFENGQHHPITSLLPTALFRAVGGFDETLAGLEDVDLYLKLQAFGVCGTRCPLPLLTYHRKDGRRGRSVRENGQYEAIKALLADRYQGSRAPNASCAPAAGDDSRCPTR